MAAASMTSHPVTAPPTGRRAARAALPTILAAAVAVAVLGGAAARTQGTSSDATQGSAARQMQLPVAARLAVSRGLGGDLQRFWVSRAPGGYVARNTGGGLSTTFDRRGARTVTRGGTANLGMTLRAVGYGKSLRTVGEVSPSAHRNRVSYAWGGLREWYANGPLGLEQGFDVARPLAAHPASPLTLSLARSGDLHAMLAAGARSVRFLAPGGRTVLRYGGLTATDARGRALHAWLSLRGARVLVHVEADGAAYPLHIDPTIEDAELTATDGGIDDDLGTSVAVSGSTIVLGAPYHAVAGKNEAGAVYVFSKPAAGDWEDATQTAELTASDAVEDGFLGVSVAVTSSTIVAGAAGHGSDAGAVYVFSKPASGDWKDATQTAELTVAGGAAPDQLGHSVAVSGATIVAGAPGETGYQGAVYIFTEPVSGNWENSSTPTAELTASDGAALDQLSAVAISEAGSTIVAAAAGHTVGGHVKQGALYVFSEPTSGGWKTTTQTAELTAGDGAADDELSAVAISEAGSTIVAGAAGHKVNGKSGAGAVYVFTEPLSGGWGNSSTPVAELTASDPGVEDFLGGSVAISGSTIVAGATFHMVNGKIWQGAAYAFSEPATGSWEDATQTAELTAENGAERDQLGLSVAISGSTIVAGAPGRMVSGNADQGAAYVLPFSLPTVSIVTPANGTTYTQGQAVAADFTCTAAAGAALKPGTAGCSGPVADGGTVDTSTLGSHSFTVTATDTDGHIGTATNSYTVIPPQTVAGPGTGTTSSMSSSKSSTSTSSTSTAAPTGAATTTQTSAALACTTAQVALIDVVRQGSHVLLTGAARLTLAGHKVSIKLLATGKVVASVEIASDGSFSTTVPLPPAKIRNTNRARYQASVGSAHSLALKLDRRAELTTVKREGKHVLISGYVTGSFRAGTPVQITLRVTCAKYRTVAKVKLSSSGTFSATVPAPSAKASEIAVYRAQTTVLQDGHPEPTDTLPTPPTA